MRNNKWWLVSLDEIIQRRIITEECYLAGKQVSLVSAAGMGWVTEAGIYQGQSVRMLRVMVNANAEDFMKSAPMVAGIRIVSAGMGKFLRCFDLTYFVFR